MRQLLLPAMATALFASALPAQVRGAGEWTAFERSFEEFCRRDSIVGAAYVVVRSGSQVRSWRYGMADRPPGVEQAVDANTIFHYGSITKTLTAVAIMQLRDRGLLSLDDPITRYIPELKQVNNPHGSMEAITLRMLLSHSSGLQNPTWPWRRYQRWEPFEPVRWDQLTAMMPYMQTQFAPGARYGYSNPAFIYLARVIEQISHDPYQSYIYKNIWVPLGMTRSFFGHTPNYLQHQRSNSFTLEGDTMSFRVVPNGREFDPGITIPNGGWNAPLADVIAWSNFLAGSPAGNAAMERHDIVLRRSSLEEMWRVVVPVGNGSPESMGLSFFLRPIRGVTIVGHTGEQAGFRSFLYFNPQTRDAVIGVVNTTNDVRYRESNAGFLAVVTAATEMLVRE